MLLVQGCQLTDKAIHWINIMLKVPLPPECLLIVVRLEEFRQLALRDFLSGT